MATLTTFTAGTSAKASEVNANFTNLNNQINAEHDSDGTHGVITPTAVKNNHVTVTDGATVTFDLDTGNSFQVTLGGNRTLAVTNGTVGQYFTIQLIQDGTGSRTVTWFSTIKWAGGSAPTLTTTASKKDTFVFQVTGSGTYDGYIAGQNI